jgi:two-component system OmpR family response regulator/two-component system alkaline phosphatase synthesis response regulator PhoP
MPEPPVRSESRGADAAPRRALVVEDEANIRELVSLHLGLEGLSVVEASSGDDAIRRTEAEAFDLVVLDLMLPKVDGITVCRSIRRQPLNGDVPVLMLTARRDESDKVLGLESGADDYLTKPFGVAELVARARALLRRPRASRPSGRGTDSAVVHAGPLRLDRSRRQAMVHGTPIDLTPHEFDVLFLLASHAGIVFTREMLLEQVWTPETHVTERSVDTLIKRLRQKVEADTRDPQLILTVWGTGYKFADG